MATAPSPPILIWTPGGGTPGGPVSNPPVYSQADVTPLVQGQAYVDVVFGSIQTTSDWVLVTCEVENTTDLAPLNIWPGIITSRTAAGFRLYLNGLPDTGNYYLHWAVSGINILPVPASLYLFTGPTSSAFGVNKTFTVKLPPSTTLTVPITIIPDDGGLGGSFSPPTVTLSSGSATATFTYNAATYGAATLSVTNSGTLIDPAPIVYTSIAPTYTFTGPSGGDSGVPSTNFTVQLPGDATLAVPTTVTPSSGGGGGTFTPTSVLLVAGVPVHFTYTPASAGTKTISVTNDGGLANPANLSYVAVTPLFDPTTISGLIGWWKAETIVGLSNGDLISTWSDSSASARHATQTGTARPAFYSNIVNGKPAVFFYGPASNYLSFTAITGSGTWTLFVVMRPNVPADFLQGMGNVSGSGQGPYLAVNNGTIFAATPAFGGASFQSPTAVWGSVFHVFDLLSDGSFYGDGTSLVQTSGAGITNTDFTRLGGPTSTGYIAEVLIYNSVLGTTDRQNVENGYLKAKYNTP